jgi:hypothetical protein
LVETENCRCESDAVAYSDTQSSIYLYLQVNFLRSRVS